MKKKETNEFCLLLGKWTSLIGNIVFDYANTVNIVSLFGTNPFVLGLYQGSESIVSIILNLFGGVAADGKNKKNLLIVTDFLSALICFIASFFVKGKRTAIVLIIANILLAVVCSFNSPVYSSIIRSVIRKERIISFNSINHTGSGIIKIAVPIVAVSLVKIIGARGALLIDAATFLMSSIFELFLKPYEVETNLVRQKEKVFAKIGKGIKYICSQKELLILILMSAGVNLFLAGYNLLLPYTDVLFQERYSGFYGKALAVEALGGILSALINAKRKQKVTTIGEMILILGMTGMGLLFVPIVFCWNSILLNILPYMFFGMFLTLYNIQFMSYVQMTADADYLGRVFSVIFSVAVLFMPVGSFLFSAVFDVGNVKMFYIIGCGIIVLAIISFLAVKTIRTKEIHGNEEK